MPFESVPPDQLAYIYDEFYQVGVPANSSRDGYGLGLSIVQRLVKLQGYHVTPVASLSEALEHVQQGNSVDLLISDYHLNDGSPNAARSQSPQRGHQAPRTEVHGGLECRSYKKVSTTSRKVSCMEGTVLTNNKGAIDLVHPIDLHKPSFIRFPRT